MSILNTARNQGRRPNPKSVKPENCPVCEKRMNICTEEKDLFYCTECLVHYKDGEIVTVDHNGEYEKPLGQVKAKLSVIKTEVKPQTLDFYFNSSDKKTFKEILPDKPQGKWITLSVKYAEQENPDIDFYFRSGDKKIFRNIEDWSTAREWLVLTKRNGKEITLNSANVNWFCTGKKIFVNSANVNWIEEV